MRTAPSRKDGEYQILRNIERGADIEPGYLLEIIFDLRNPSFLFFLTMITCLCEVLKSENTVDL